MAAARYSTASTRDKSRDGHSDATQWVSDLFACLDAGDADGFVEALTDDARFIFANMPAVNGRQAIHEFVEGFLESIDKTAHTLHEIIEAPGKVIIRGEVAYTRLDGSTLEAPFANIFDLVDGGIETYQVYVDNSQLY